jgi:hypothetical protein
MAKAKKVVPLEVPVPSKEAVEAAKTVFVPVPEEVKGEVPVVKSEAPAVVTGSFYTLKREDKFVVVNRLGQIVSKPMDESKAIEMAQRYQGLTR